MSERAGIGCARLAAGRIGAVTAVLAVLASLAGFSARPAAAGLVSGDSIPETTVLPANVDVLPGDTADTGTFVLTVPIRLQAGQSRRISDQLTVTVPRNAVVQNIVECVDPLSGNPVTIAGRPEAHSSGTNYSPSMGQFSMHASFLFTAPVTGTFFCQIRAQTDAGNDLGFHMTVVAAPRPGGTWLEIDNFTDAAPLWWQINTCQSNGRDPETGGTDPNCIFLGRPDGAPDHPTTAILHGWPPSVLDTPFLHMSDLWSAPPDATEAGAVGHMQITSCYFDTASCPEREQGTQDPGPLDVAVFRTHLDLIQLDQHFAVCKVNSTPDTQYTITNAVHHFLVDYGPLTVPVSQTCGGSRVFALHIVVSWHAGNTVKIDAGSFIGFRSATNANVIVRSTRPTTTVPRVIGVDQGSVAGHLAGSGLTMGTVTRVANPVAAGHVIAQNSPPGTIEPAGSPVDLTISLGAVAVPDLESLTAGQAISALHAVGLAAHIQYRAQCVDLGLVIDQTPSAGTSVAPGSTVTVTIASGTLHSC